jgi:hypothetical protein
VTGPSYKISSRFRVIVWSWCKVLGCLWFPHECATGLAASVVEIYPKSCTNVDVSLPVFLDPLDPQDDLSANEFLRAHAWAELASSESDSESAASSVSVISTSSCAWLAAAPLVRPIFSLARVLARSALAFSWLI